MKIRPGPGWSHWLLSPVHEHTSGIRVHMMGTISLPLPKEAGAVARAVLTRLAAIRKTF
jgi:hypothetical protein